MAEPAPAHSNLPERIDREHLRLALRQVGRIPFNSILIDSFLAWLVFRLGYSALAGLWFVVLLAAQLLRWRHVLKLGPVASADPLIDPRAALRRLSALLLLLGLLRAAVLPVLFAQPVLTEHFMLTMVYLGLIAGTGASVGGEVRPFVVYVVLVGGSLALAWALQGTADGLWIGALLIALVTVMGANLRDQSQGLKQFVKLACDNEQLAASLGAARDAAEAASLSKTRFFAAASHDLRQPLHALSINATTLELLATRQANPLIKDLSNSINRALGQSNSLLDSLLEISKLDAQAVKPQIYSVDVVAVLASVREEFAALAAQKGLALRLEVPVEPDYPDQPQPSTPPALLAATDEVLLRRILINLVGNALKFTLAGTVTLRARRVGTGAANLPTPLMVTVTDTGPGIAADQQARVFEEFYQLGNTARDRNLGLGLGLAIVQRIAGLLNAPLRLISTPGQGTSVELTLPPAAPTLTPAAPAQPGTALHIDMLDGMRVLVVDDEVEIQRSLQGLLAQLGCTLRCASDQGGAMAWLDQGFAPQVLLIDHRLRGEHGAQVITALQARLGPVPAVLVTGDTEPALIQAARAAGHRVLHKPVQGQVLAGLLLALAHGDGAAAPGAPPVHGTGPNASAPAAWR